ncbi:zinc-binding dehydrogenase domain-containing protein [Ditylenchus destructor]|nr:zinc-binding dehydrogenase domain-containing protein [Ditylenchus destructor]
MSAASARLSARTWRFSKFLALRTLEDGRRFSGTYCKMSTNPESIPKTQRAACYDKPNDPIQIRDIPVPEPGDDDLLVKVLFSGVCHSDLHVWQGDFSGVDRKPNVGGHEGAGIVVKMGKNVSSFKVGDRAGIKWINGTCLSCAECKQGWEPNCPKAVVSGLHRNGSFQQYALVKASEASPIPEKADMAHVAPILCAGVTVFKGLKEAHLTAGEIVAITGASGGLGSFAIQYAKAMGYRVMAIDKKESEEHCRELGAEWFVDFRSKDLVQQIQSLTDGGPHAVLDIAPAQESIETSVQYVRTRGTVVVIALPKDVRLNALVTDLVLRALTVKGSYVGTRHDTDQAMDFFARGLIEVPVKIIPLSELATVYKAMMDKKISGRYVLDLWK